MGWPEELLVECLEFALALCGMPCLTGVQPQQAKTRVHGRQEMPDVRQGKMQAGCQSQGLKCLRAGLIGLPVPAALLCDCVLLPYMQAQVAERVAAAAASAAFDARLPPELISHLQTIQAKGCRDPARWGVLIRLLLEVEPWQPPSQPGRLAD